MPYGWEEYKRLSGVSEQMAKYLARSGREVGSNYRDWRVGFEPIPLDQWLRIEIEDQPDHWLELSVDLATMWTRPVLEKGCVRCEVTEAVRQWRYLPCPDTGEPRMMCEACYDDLYESWQRLRREADGVNVKER